MQLEAGNASGLSTPSTDEHLRRLIDIYMHRIVDLTAETTGTMRNLMLALQTKQFKAPLLALLLALHGGPPALEELEHAILEQCVSSVRLEAGLLPLDPATFSLVFSAFACNTALRKRRAASTTWTYEGLTEATKAKLRFG